MGRWLAGMLAGAVAFTGIPVNNVSAAETTAELLADFNFNKSISSKSPEASNMLFQESSSSPAISSDVSKSDGKTLEELCSAFVNEDAQKIEQIYGEYLWNTISIRDTAVAKEKKENFYHGILLGLLGYKSGIDADCDIVYDDTFDNGLL